MRQITVVMLFLLGLVVSGCSILERTKLAPVAIIEVIPQQGHVPLEVLFNGEFSHDFYGKIESYEWDLGDNTTETTSQFNHTYTNPGRYEIKLTVTNSLGLKNTAKATVIATRRPGPVPPTNLSAIALEDKLQIDLSWSDQSNDEQGFLVERKRQDGRFVEIDTVDADLNTYSDRRNLETDTTYCYRVRAFNDEGKSDYTNQTCATTTDAPEGSMVGKGNDLIDATREITINNGEIQVTVTVTAKVELELVAVVEELDGLELVDGKLSEFSVNLKPDGEPFVHTYTLQDSGNDGGTISGKIRAKPADEDSQILELDTVIENTSSG